MKVAIVMLALLLGGILMLPVGLATANPGQTRKPSYGHALPFPRNARAAAIWGEGACWSACQASCTWGLASCLSVDAQGRCLKHTDACDRSCQRACRTRGGPYVDTY